MRVLVATHRTNGLAEGDYNFCVEGELVYVQNRAAVIDAIPMDRAGVVVDSAG